MSNPQASTNRPRYQMIRELGRNRAGGRITYLAKDNVTQEQVIVKRFLFAQADSDWSGFKAYEREIQVLRGLDHFGIPRYLDSFESKAGFCMVQEYKDAQSLVVLRSFDPDEIKRIAVSILEILVYLQNRIPVVLHRDIKPENVLVDDQLNVYLVDFGFARIGGGDVAVSSVAAGTFGFMAPEQMYNRQLSDATDLYGLGATLICLLTGTKSTAVDSLITEEGRINFQHLLPKLSLRFVGWLSKMVEPKVKDRFPSAAAALEALHPIDVTRVPEVKFSQLMLEFKTKQLGEQLSQTVTVYNSDSETLLSGSWEVAPHPNDPRFNKHSHAWISVQPAKFDSNQVDCQVTVNTNRLMPDQTYSRQLLLHSNSFPETHVLTIQVHTTLLETPKTPYIALGLLFLTAGALTWFWTGLVTFFVTINPMLGVIFIGGFLCGFLGGAILSVMGLGAALPTKIAMWSIGLLMLVNLFLGGILAALSTSFVGLAGLITGFVMGAVIKNHQDRGFSGKDSFTVPLLMTGLGMSLGTGFIIGFGNPFLVLSVLGTALSLIAMMIYPRMQREKLLANYRQSMQTRRLIKP